MFKKILQFWNFPAFEKVVFAVDTLIMVMIG